MKQRSTEEDLKVALQNPKEKLSQFSLSKILDALSEDSGVVQSQKRQTIELYVLSIIVINQIDTLLGLYIFNMKNKAGVKVRAIGQPSLFMDTDLVMPGRDASSKKFRSGESKVHQHSIRQCGFIALFWIQFPGLSEK